MECAGSTVSRRTPQVRRRTFVRSSVDCHAARLFRDFGDDQVVEQNRIAGIGHGAGAGAFARGRLRFKEGERRFLGFLGTFLPELAGDGPLGFFRFRDLKFEEGPFAAGPLKGNGSFQRVAAIKFELLFGGSDAELVSADAAEADIEDGEAAALRSCEDACLNGDVFTFARTEKKAERIERRAGKFEEFVTLLLLHGELAFDDHEFVGHAADFGLLQIVLIKHFGAKIRGGDEE